MVNRSNPGYAGKMPIEKVVSVMSTARGHAGTPAEYLFETVNGLQAHGLRDSYLLDLRRRLEECGCGVDASDAQHKPHKPGPGE